MRLLHVHSRKPGEGGAGQALARVSWKRLSAGYLGVLVRLPPTRQRLLTIRGIARREAGFPRQAIRDFSAAIVRVEGRAGRRQAVDAAMAYAGRGKAWRKLAEREGRAGNVRGRENYLAAARDDLKNAVGLFARGGEGALCSWELAYVLNALGEVYLAMGHPGLAELCFEDAMLACPRFGKAKKNWRAIDLRHVYE